MAGVNMQELSALFRMGMRIMPASLSSPVGGSITTIFISCSRFWMIFYAMWLLFMDMFFTIFPTTLIFISGLTLIMHYTRIPAPPNQFVHAVFGLDPHIELPPDMEEDNDTQRSSVNTVARQLVNQVMNTAVTTTAPGLLSKKQELLSGLSGMSELVKKSLEKPSDDGFATPVPDLILEQGVVSSSHDVPFAVIGHRGASADVPENCLGALKYCKEKGCHYVFLDVSITKDNVGVLFHDEDLVRVAGINKKLKSLTWEQVKNVDVSTLHGHRDKLRGQCVPSLESAVETCIQLNIKFFINVVDSSDEMIDVVCRTYKSNKAMYSMAAVTSFHWRVIYGIRKRDPKIIGCLAFPLSLDNKLKSDVTFHIGHLAHSTGVNIVDGWHHFCDNFLDWFLETFLWWYLGLTAIFIHKDGISKNEVREWNSKGIRVFVWMLETKEEKAYINKTLETAYLTNTFKDDPILDPAKKKKESMGDENKNKKPGIAKVKRPIESVSTVSSADSMHSIAASPEEGSAHSAYVKHLLSTAAAQLQ